MPGPILAVQMQLDKARLIPSVLENIKASRLNIRQSHFWNQIGFSI